MNVKSDKVISLIAIFFFSLILAIVYGNGVIYHNFPEIPNMILSFFDHLDGERAYDSISKLYSHSKSPIDAALNEKPLRIPEHLDFQMLSITTLP